VRVTGRRTIAGGALLALCGVLGYAASGIAATSSGAGAPLSSSELAKIQADVNSAVTLELRAVSDLKKKAPIWNKKALAAIRSSQTDLTAALTSLDQDGFRTIETYKVLSTAANDDAVALVAHTNKVGYLQSALVLKRRALTQLPPLTVVSTTATQTSTTG